MDEVLKERKLGSATARRKRMQEREQAREEGREIISQALKERKMQVLLYGESDEEEPEAGDDRDSFYGALGPGFDRASSVETPSDMSVLTPDDTPSPPPTKWEREMDFALQKFNSPFITLQLPSEEKAAKKSRSDSQLISPPSPGLVLNSSLLTLSDFNFDRFSAVINPSDIEDLISAEEDQEPYSPIEIATPILYSQPMTRPAVIHITNIPPRAKSRTSVSQSSRPLPQPRSHSPSIKRRPSHVTPRAEFLASKTLPIEIPVGPVDFSITEPIAKQSCGSVSEQANFGVRPERTPAEPLHPVTSKFNPTRSMSMIGHHTSLAMSPAEDRDRPTSSAIVNMGYGAKYSQRQQPSVSSDPTGASFGAPAATTLSSPRFEQVDVSAELTSPEITSSVASSKGSSFHIARKKSMSALRSRGESIGLALKSSVKQKSRLSRRPDVPALPPIVVTAPRGNHSVDLDLNSFPTPPQSPLLAPPKKSPRNSVVSYSPFPPPAPKRIGSGLGLKGVDGVVGVR